MSRGELFGPYRLEELIGRGGMGEVYRAHDTRRDRVVALKILPPEMATPKFEARFRQESRLVARLSAPHIIPIHDFGEFDGRLFLDMRLVRGVDLGTVLESGPLTAPRAVEVISQLAGALDAAHADGLVHRDVKPSNVLYVGDPRTRRPGADDADFVYLVDFGIARSLDEASSLTATGHAVGTLAYMAPERFNGEPADPRIDVYALACTLYETLVGRPAFAGAGLAPMMYEHLHRMPRPVSLVDPGLPAALDEVLDTGLAKDPADRYPSAGRLAEAARAALRGPPPRVATISPPVAEPPDTPQELITKPWGGPDPTAAHGPTDTPPDPAPPVPAPTRPLRGPPPTGRRRALRITGAALAASVLAAGAVVGVRALAADPNPAGLLTDCRSSPLTCNGAEPDELLAGGQVTVAINSNIENWNVAAPTGAAGPAGWVMGSVLPHTFTIGPDYTPTLNTDLLAEARQTSPTSVVYVVRAAARWDDGTPVGVDDFAFTWRMRNGRDCPTCFTDPAGYDRITTVTGTPAADGGSTVTVTFDAPFPDWATLFANTSPLYPAHLAAGRGDLRTAAGLKAAYDWFGATVPNYSAGPMSVQSWQPGRELVLARNPRWYGRPARLDRVLLQVTPDPAAQVRGLRDGQLQVIAPYGRAGLADTLAGTAGVDLFSGAGPAWERVDLNLRSPALRAPALRQALFTGIDLGRVRAVGAEVFGTAEPMGSHTFVPGQPGYRDLLAGTGQGSGDLEAARRLLTAAGYTGVGSALVGPDGVPVPALRAVYVAAHPARERVVSYVAEVGRGLGLAVEPQVITPDGYRGALAGGRYDLVFHGWAMPPARIADAQANWTTDGISNHGGYSNPRVDRLIADATSGLDAAAADEKLDQADRLLTADAYVLPLFRRPTMLGIRRDVANVRNNAAVGPLYNVADWGVRS